VFDEIAGGSGKGAIIGKEGQVAVMAHEGKTEKALALADEVIKKAPQRSLAHKIKGDLLAGKGQLQEAETAYEKAVQQPEAAPPLLAEAYNQLRANSPSRAASLIMPLPWIPTIWNPHPTRE